MIPDALWAVLGAAIMAVIALPLGRYFGRSEGRREAQGKAQEADIARANKIEDQADEARRTRDTSAPVDDRLREHGRLRD